MRLRHAVTVAAVAAASLIAVSSDAQALPTGCSSFYSNQFATGYAHGKCTSGTGWFRTRVRCHPEGTTASYVSRFGDWKNVQLTPGAISGAECGPRYPVAFDSDVFVTNTNPNPAPTVAGVQGLSLLPRADVARAPGSDVAECPDAVPVLRKWNQTGGCTYDGDNTLVMWWPANFGSDFVRGECDDFGGHYFRARRGVHLCDDPDF